VLYLEEEADLAREVHTGPSTVRQSRTDISKRIGRKAAMRKSHQREKIQQNFNLLDKKAKSVDLKLKNSKRALKLAKTLFGMVDEMDTMDFSSAKENAQVALLNKEARVDSEYTLLDAQKSSAKAGLESRSSNIVDLVARLEHEMTKFKYSKLSLGRVPEGSPPSTLQRQSIHPQFQQRNPMLHDSSQFEASDDTLSNSQQQDQSSSIAHEQNCSPDDFKAQAMSAGAGGGNATDLFSQFFIDPFKYHELAEEAD